MTGLNTQVSLWLTSSGNDNDKFEVAENGTQLKLKDGVTTDFSSQEEYVVEVYAQDYDADGNASRAHGLTLRKVLQ